ncbi:MAG TPA: hypothetical protein VL475_16415 [Planctomycetaceae bacterium]|nr:hypothetical protein [Planctomycetaceae bacterium]
MDPNYRAMIDFLRGLGTEDVPHSGEKGFLAHLVAVYRDLEAWHCDRDVCRAGLFHSIYGTELFRRFALPLEKREEVRALIGERAERIAFVNCVMDRSTFDALLESDGPYRIRNRETGETIELSRADYDDLVRVHLCDWLEQVERSQRWDYRRDAYDRMARRLGGVAAESHQRVYALEAAAGASS